MTSTRLARTALPYASVLLLTLASPTASAQLDAGAIDAGISDGAATAPALSSADFAFSIERYDALAGTWVRLNPTEQAFFFNRARCECAADTSNFTGSIKIAIEPDAAAVPKIQALLAANLVGSGSARLYAGGNAVNCLLASSTVAPAYCLNLLDPSSYTASIPGGMAVFSTQRTWESPPIPIAWLFGAAQAPVCNSPQSCNQTSACGNTVAAPTIYFWAQTSAAPTPDRSDLSFTVNLVGQEPYGAWRRLLGSARPGSRSCPSTRSRCGRGAGRPEASTWFTMGISISTSLRSSSRRTNGVWAKAMMATSRTGIRRCLPAWPCGRQASLRAPSASA